MTRKINGKILVRSQLRHPERAKIGKPPMRTTSGASSLCHRHHHHHRCRRHRRHRRCHRHHHRRCHHCCHRCRHCHRRHCLQHQPGTSNEMPRWPTARMPLGLLKSQVVVLKFQLCLGYPYLDGRRLLGWSNPGPIVYDMCFDMWWLSSPV